MCNVTTKAVLFDLTQTLVDSAGGFRQAEDQAKRRIFRDIGATSWDDFLRHYRTLRKQFHQTAPHFSRRAMWQEVYQHYRHRPDPAQLAKWELDYWDKVRAKTVPFPETLSVLEELAGRFGLALVTNKQGPSRCENHTLDPLAELKRFFAVTIVAGESGIPPKPDPAPFLLCLERLGVPAGQAVYVGDDWRIDVCGARSAGIRPIWIKHHTVRRKWPAGEASVPVIEKLDQLLDPRGILARPRPSA